MLILIGLWFSALSSLFLLGLGLTWHFDFRQQNDATESSSRAPIAEKEVMEEKIGLNEELHASDHLEIVPPSSDFQEATQSSTLLNEPNHSQIAVIIDDLGYQWGNGIRSIELDGNYTLSILPFSPYAAKLAQQANKMGKEIMLHVPMEPLKRRAWDGGLEIQMSRHEIETKLTQMLENVPLAKGVNNHMGSALTQDRQIMSWIMEELAERNLYFIDSVTTPLSTAYSEARHQSVRAQKRDVFLDNNRNYKAINAQFTKLLELAQKYGTAIAICHPYPETLAFLEKAKIRLVAHNVHLVSITNLLSTREQLAKQKKSDIDLTRTPAKLTLQTLP